MLVCQKSSWYENAGIQSRILVSRAFLARDGIYASDRTIRCDCFVNSFTGLYDPVPNYHLASSLSSTSLTRDGSDTLACLSRCHCFKNSHIGSGKPMSLFFHERECSLSCEGTSALVLSHEREHSLS